MDDRLVQARKPQAASDARRAGLADDEVEPRLQGGGQVERAPGLAFTDLLGQKKIAMEIARQFAVEW